MIRKQRALYPGPTPIAPGVAQAIAASAGLHHRSDGFRAMFARVQAGLGAFMLGESHDPPPTSLRSATSPAGGGESHDPPPTSLRSATSPASGGESHDPPPTSLRSATSPASGGGYPPVLLAGSGTLALEASIVNLLNPGDHAFCVVSGRFAQRWADMAEALGMRVTRFETPWGAALEPDQLRQAMQEAQAQAPLRALLLAGVETSTGALADLAEVSAITREFDQCLLCVDGITLIGAHEVPVLELGIDTLSFASQKALGVPPGLAALWLSQRAWQRAEHVSTPRSYLDLLRERDDQARGSMSYTAPIPQIAGLAAALEWVDSLESGRATLIQNTATLAHATRAGLSALGLSVLAASPAQSLSVVVLDPLGPCDAEAIRRELRESHGVEIAGGQQQLKGRALRFSHMGYTDAGDALVTLAALERVLHRRELIQSDQLGASLSAFQASLQNLD